MLQNNNEKRYQLEGDTLPINLATNRYFESVADIDQVIMIKVKTAEPNGGQHYLAVEFNYADNRRPYSVMTKVPKSRDMLSFMIDFVFGRRLTRDLAMFKLHCA
jgi:hypothetical protein